VVWEPFQKGLEPISRSISDIRRTFHGSVGLQRDFVDLQGVLKALNWSWRWPPVPKVVLEPFQKGLEPISGSISDIRRTFCGPLDIQRGSVDLQGVLKAFNLT